MKKKDPEEQNWEVRELGRAIASFFERRESSPDAKVLGELTGKLAQKAGEGASHLTPGEVAEITPDANSFSVVGNEEANLPLVMTSADRLYFRRHFEYENQIARALALRVARPAVDPDSAALDFFRQSLAPQVDEHQALAVGTAMRKDLLLLSGGPGTGKTRTIVIMLAALLHANPELRIALAAPTGKAAFRMRESVLQTMDALDLPEGIRSSLSDCAEATTLHRLLGWQAGSVDFKRNENNPLLHDLVVLDEASMVDLPMMAKFCAALRDEAKLALVGDADQLAPVQGGPVFNGLVRAYEPNRFSSSDLAGLANYSSVGEEAGADDRLAGSLVSLALSHRREGSPSASVLGDFCDAIRDGEGDSALKIVQKGGGCMRLIESLDDDVVNSTIKDEFEALSETTDPLSALSALSNFRILCAHNKGRYGVESWNRRTEFLLSEGEDRPSPIVIGVNDYTVRLFNGDDGIILGKQAHFSGEGGMRKVARSRLPGNSPGYATTIHRSQGSEYEKVMIILPREESKLLTRELLYVAASRAKREITLVGNPKSFLAAIANQDSSCSGVSTLFENELDCLPNDQA
ncbi:MAG: exodeoxyribonuclease V subunit alpha [Opitutae bacterium]|jgi:exodeoxyribonuclease V alpha subunit|nr:exodeoxyribonuclease V subunit alpha [Opitutae bacterium]